MPVTPPWLFPPTPSTAMHPNPNLGPIPPQFSPWFTPISFTPIAPKAKSNLGSMVFFEELKTKLRAKFSQPYPSDISVLHHKCGGEVTYKQHYEMDDTYDELVCGKDGCEKVWTEKVLNRATAVEIHDWFTGRDNTVYKLETSAVDEYGNKQPRVYSFLKTK